MLANSIVKADAFLIFLLFIKLTNFPVQQTMQITELIQRYFHLDFGGRTVANWVYKKEFLGKVFSILYQNHLLLVFPRRIYPSTWFLLPTVVSCGPLKASEIEERLNSWSHFYNKPQLRKTWKLHLALIGILISAVRDLSRC